MSQTKFGFCASEGVPLDVKLFKPRKQTQQNWASASKHLSWLQMPSWHSAVLLAKAKQARLGTLTCKTTVLKTRRNKQDKPTSRPADRGRSDKHDEKHSRQVKTKPVHFPRKLCSAQASFRHSTAISLGKLGNLRVTYITRAAHDAVRRQSERAVIIAFGIV